MTATHPIVDRIAEFSRSTLNVRDLGYVFEKTERWALALIHTKRISSIQESVGKNIPRADLPTRQVKRQRYHITPGAVLLYLISITEGDKTDLLEAIKVRFPALHGMCKAAAEGKTVETPEAPNIINATEEFQSSRKRRQPSPPPGEHLNQMELFTLPANATASA